MSIYKPAKSPFYSYDFEIKGFRFYGSTKCRSKSEARIFERQCRKDAADELKKSAYATSAPMTINVAFDRFWVEKGQGYSGNYKKTFFAALAWLANHLGPNTLIRDVGRRKISDAINARKIENVKPATINRTVLEPLRLVINRARKHWEEKVQEIPWGDFFLDEPKERVRELSSDEEGRIFKSMREDYHPILLFALFTGFRLGECVGLKWDDVDFGDLTIKVVGKGDKFNTVPISKDVRDFLWDLRGHHSHSVFTYVALRNLPQRKFVKGQRYPITYSGLSTAWRRAKLSAALIDYRFHDNRHTAATRFLRATGNVKLAQHFLRHEHVATTMKYAHASTEDLRQALQTVSESRNKPRNDGTERKNVNKIVG
jgi:integrase